MTVSLVTPPGYLTGTPKSVNCPFRDGYTTQSDRRSPAGFSVSPARGRFFLRPLLAWAQTRRVAPRYCRPRRGARQMGPRIAARASPPLHARARRRISPPRSCHLRESHRARHLTSTNPVTPELSLRASCLSLAPVLLDLSQAFAVRPH